MVHFFLTEKLQLTNEEWMAEYHHFTTLPKTLYLSNDHHWFLKGLGKLYNGEIKLTTPKPTDQS